jgi:hypothetical protein
MCAQCMAGAATAVAGASGIRAFVAARRPAWMTQRRLRLTTAGLMTAAVLLAGLGGAN